MRHASIIVNVMEDSLSIACPATRAYPFGPPQQLLLHPTYQEVQDKEPLCRVQMPYGDAAWLVTRYDDVKAVLGDPRFVRSAGTRSEPRVTPDVLPLGLMDMDPPDHNRYRRVIAKAFTPRRVERLRPRIEEITAELLDRMMEAGPPAYLMQCLGLPLPTMVICELLGIPYDDRDKFQTWTNSALSARAVSPEYRAECIGKLFTYMSGQVERRREHPADDVLSALATARDKDDRMTDSELALVAMALVGGGYETTARQIGNFTYLLLTHPDQLALLRADPGLIPRAVEELLRYVPVGTTSFAPRYASCDIELSGGTVLAGDPVFASSPMANRDPSVFVDPDRLDITRTPGPHMTFGYGAHHCVGAPLARLELQVALRQILERMPALHCAVDLEALEWLSGGLVRGLVALPVGW
jgi:cytochrome P450